MTVKELIDVSPYCDLVEVVVRKNGHGQWIQGYRVGKEAKLYPCNLTKEVMERFKVESHLKTVHLQEGQEVDCSHGSRELPMKVICKDVSKIPDNIGKLIVAHVQPRHIPSFHKEQLTHNDFAYNIDCYPDGYVPEVEKKDTDWENLEGQLTIDDWLGEER